MDTTFNYEMTSTTGIGDVSKSHSEYHLGTPAGSSTGVHLHHALPKRNFSKKEKVDAIENLIIEMKERAELRVAIVEQTRRELLRELFGDMVLGQTRTVVNMGGNIRVYDQDEEGFRKVVATEQELTEDIAEGLAPKLPSGFDVPNVEEPESGGTEKGWYQDSRGELYEYLGNGKWNAPSGVVLTEVVKKSLAGELEFLG